MLFIQDKKFYHFKYSKIEENYTISIFLDKNNLNFYFLYYDEETKSYISKVLYSFDIGYSNEENLSVLENIDFYLTNKASELEHGIASKLPDNIFNNDISNNYIHYFNDILETFFDENKNIKNHLFKTLFLSFIFELYQCDTFKNTKLYNHLKNNRIFKIFGSKLQYKLSKRIMKETHSDNNNLNQQESLDRQLYFKRQEKRWINTLFDKKNKSNLEYANGYELISSSEKELTKILSKNRVEKLDAKEDKELILMSSNYFLSALNISKVFNIITKNHSFKILSIMFLSILTFILSLFLSSEQNQIPQGFVISVFPLMLFFITCYILLKRGINYLSILIMPRLFFSIFISWVALISSYDLFYAHIHHDFSYFVILNILFLLIIISYYSKEIKYKRVKKIFSILTVSIFISLIEGFFIIKFYIQSFINRSFTTENYINYLKIDHNLCQSYRYSNNLEINSSNYELISGLPDANITLFTVKNINQTLYNFFTIDVYVLFAFIMLPVFFGLILQTVMDDKSIFKPLK